MEMELGWSVTEAFGYSLAMVGCFLQLITSMLLLWSQKMVNGGNVSYWACINFSRNVAENVARDFCIQLAQMCLTSGMVCFAEEF